MAPYYGLPLKYCDGTDAEQDSHHQHHSYESSYASQMEENEDQQPISDKAEDNVEDARDIDIQNIFDRQKIFQQQESPTGDEAVELSSLSANVFPDIGSPPPEKCVKSNIKTKVFRGVPTEKFVWNSYILEGLKKMVHPDWLLNIIHGFVGQSSKTNKRLMNKNARFIFWNNGQNIHGSLHFIVRSAFGEKISLV